MESKGADTPACNAGPAKGEAGGVMEMSVHGTGSDLRVQWIPGGERHPGLRADRCPSRGSGKAEALVDSRGRRDHPALRTTDRRHPAKGCSSSSLRRGTFNPARPAAAGLPGRSFAPGCSARAVQRHRPTTVVANDCWVKAPPASGVVIGRWFPRSFGLRRSCSAAGSASEGLSRLAASASLPREGKVAALRKENSDSEGESGLAAKERGSRRTRESGPRRCVRGSEAVAEVDGRQSGPVKRASAVGVEIAERDDACGRGSSAW